jgi:CheY-like chemotaxis protein
MAEVLALVDDLFFQMKMMETAKQVGVELRACRTPEALTAEIEKESPRLVVIDLNASGDPLAAIETVNRMRARAAGDGSSATGPSDATSHASGEGSNGSSGQVTEGAESSDGTNELGGRKIAMIAFLSHVQVDLAAKARAAGCGDVMPRSKFTQNLATILAGAKSESA